jgi:hypothetical protein
MAEFLHTTLMWEERGYGGNLKDNQMMSTGQMDNGAPGSWLSGKD